MAVLSHIEKSGGELYQQMLQYRSDAGLSGGALRVHSPRQGRSSAK